MASSLLPKIIHRLLTPITILLELIAIVTLPVIAERRAFLRASIKNFVIDVHKVLAIALYLMLKLDLRIYSLRLLGGRLAAKESIIVWVHNLFKLCKRILRLSR